MVDYCSLLLLDNGTVRVYYITVSTYLQDEKKNLMLNSMKTSEGVKV